MYNQQYHHHQCSSLPPHSLRYRRDHCFITSQRFLFSLPLTGQQQNLFVYRHKMHLLLLLTSDSPILHHHQLLLYLKFWFKKMIFFLYDLCLLLSAHRHHHQLFYWWHCFLSTTTMAPHLRRFIFFLHYLSASPPRHSIYSVLFILFYFIWHT